MDNSNLRGMGVALTTPFNDDLSIDYDTLDFHIDYLIEQGVDYIVALGTTAETPTLTTDEKMELESRILDRVAGRVPVVVGVGGNNTSALIRELASTPRIREFAAILSVVPYYNKPTQEGMYRHFSAIAEASPIPVILYNIPGRSGVNMEVDTVMRLARQYPDKIIGIKEASGNMDQIRLVITRRPKGFLVLSGDDSLAHNVIGHGGDGVISVIGNAYPKEFTRMIRLSLNDETHTSATPLHQRFSAFYTLLFKDGNPAGIKCLLHHLFPRYKEVLRLPLVPASDTTRDAMSHELL